MKKKILLIVILILCCIINVNAKKISDRELKETYAKYKNPKTGVIDLDYVAIPIILFGGCLVVHNISQNKNKK